jgi:hypothetical protein
MAPTDDAGCSGAGNPLTSLSRLALQNGAMQQDKFSRKPPGMEENIRLQRTVTKEENDRVTPRLLLSCLLSS